MGARARTQPDFEEERVAEIGVELLPVVILKEPHDVEVPEDAGREMAPAHMEMRGRGVVARAQEPREPAVGRRPVHLENLPVEAQRVGEIQRRIERRASPAFSLPKLRLVASRPMVEPRPMLCWTRRIP